MDFQNSLFKAGNRFENLTIKSNTIKGIYFMVMQILTARFISVIFLIPCQLFSKVQIGMSILENLTSQIKQNQITTFILLVLSVVTLIGLVYVAIFNKNQLASKYAFVSVMFLQQISPIFGIFFLSVFARNQISFALKLVSVIQFMILEGLSFATDKVLISCTFQGSNLFAHRNNNMVAYLRLAQKGILYLAYVISSNTQISTTISHPYYISLVLIQFMKINLFIKEKYYIDQVSNLMEIFASIISFTILSQTLGFEIYPVESFKTNLFVLWPIVSLFGFISVKTYLTQKTNSCIFKNIDQINEKNQTLNYLQTFYLLWKRADSDYYSLIIASIRKNHEYLCRKPKCYCHQAKLVDQRKENLSESNRFFLKGYYQQILKFIDKQNKNQDQIFLKIMYFKFMIFNNCVKISRQLTKISCSLFDNLELAMGKNILQKNIQAVYQKLSNTNRNGSLKVDLPMELNKTMVELESIVINDIYTKNKKWSTLDKNFCKALEIEEEINKEIINLRKYDEIYDFHKQKYRKSIAFNALSLFYFGDVAFIYKKIESIQLNLRQLRSPVKYREVVNNKELAKHIIDSRCCLLQIDLSSNESAKINQLPISNCTNNVKEIFLQEKENFINTKLENLFPKFLIQMENKFFSKIIDPNEEVQSTEACDKYFVDKSGHVFEALVNLKIITKNDKIVLMMLVFQKQTKNILLLNERGFIENIGITFIDYFGRLYEGVPFSSFFYFEDQYENMSFTQKILKNKFIFLNALQLGEIWAQYLQKIKSYIKRKQTTKTLKLKEWRETSKSLETKVEEQHKNDKEMFQFMRNQKRQLIRTKILTSKQLKNVRDTHKTLSTAAATSILSVVLDYKSVKYDKFEFKIVIIDEVKRKKSPSDQTQYAIKTLQNIHERTNGRKFKGTLNELSEEDDEKFFLEELQNEDDLKNSVDLEEERKRKQRQKQLLCHQASSVNSSMNASSISYFFFKFIETCFNLFKNPGSVNDQRLRFFTVASIITACLLSGLVVTTYILFNLGLYEIKDIFFADGAVSDNMQLTEFMYNRGMNFKQFKDQPVHFQKVKQAAYFEREYLYELTAHDLDRFIADETSMTKTRFYEYIRVPTTWHFLDPTVAPVQLQTNQFLAYYYHLSREVEKNILNQTNEAQNALQLMRINFPQMKRINHQNLQLYKHMSQDSIELLRQLIVVLAISHVVLSIVLFLLFYRQKTFRRNQLMESYSIYKILPQKVVGYVASYYDFYCQQVKNQKDLAKFETHYDRHSLYLPLDQTNMKLNKNFFQQRKSFFTPSIWKMLFVTIILNIFFGVMLNTIKNLFGPIDLMMKNVNNLMDSENYLIEAYLDVKAKFIIEENFINLDPEFFEDFLESQQSIEVIFNKISVESLDLFSNYDETYKTDFINLLVKDICELIKNDIDPKQLQSCKSSIKVNYIGNGVIVGMNFFTRRVRGLMEELKRKFQTSKAAITNMTQADQAQILAQLKSLDFRQIDQSLIFMFKMYQATQQRIYLSLQNAIINIMETSYWIVVIEVLIIGILYPIFLSFNFKAEKVLLSELYVSFLLIPTPLVKILKCFGSKIEQILQYEKSE